MLADDVCDRSMMSVDVPSVTVCVHDSLSKSEKATEDDRFRDHQPRRLHVRFAEVGQAEQQERESIHRLE